MALEQLPRLSSQATLVERIKYQLSIGTPFIFVTGEDGTGKTVCCEQIISILDEMYQCAYIPCIEDMDISKAREYLLNQLSPSTIFNADDRLIGTVQRINFEKDRVLIVIDNVDRISSSFLVELAEIYQAYKKDRLFSIIVTSSPQWAEMRVKVFKDFSITPIEMEVSQLNLSEAINVYMYYLKFYNIKGIDETKLKDDKRLLACNGNPGKIRKLVDDLMNENKSSQLPDGSNSVAKSSKKSTKTSQPKFTNKTTIIGVACASMLLVGGIAAYLAVGNSTQEPVITDIAKIETDLLEDKIVPELFSDTEISASNNSANNDVFDTNELRLDSAKGNDNNKVSVTAGEKQQAQGDSVDTSKNVEVAVNNSDIQVVEQNEQNKQSTELAQVVDNKNSEKVTENNGASQAPNLKVESKTDKAEITDSNKVATTSKEVIAKKDEQKVSESTKLDVVENKDSKKELATTTVKTDVIAKDEKPKEKLDKVESKPEKVDAKTEKKSETVAKNDNSKKDENATEAKKPVETEKIVVKTTGKSFDELDNKHYTIQLMATKSKKDAEGLAKTLTGDTWVLFRNKDSKYILLYGDFENRNIAGKAINALPDSIKKSGPWAKAIGAVKSEIK